MDERLADTVELLRQDHGLAVEVEDRTILLVDPVKGDIGHAVLRVLGLAQDASPVAAAAHGPTGVAAGAWRSPELYLARWTKGRRWVVGYRLTGGAKPHDYVRTEGRIPTRLEIGNWYGPVPDPVGEAFFDGGLLLDEPPFPLPPQDCPPPTAPARVPPAGRARAAAAKPAPATGKARPKPMRPVPASNAPSDNLRLCPGCRMHKGPTQFVPQSEVCVDCR